MDTDTKKNWQLQRLNKQLEPSLDYHYFIRKAA